MQTEALCCCFPSTKLLISGTGMILLDARLSLRTQCRFLTWFFLFKVEVIQYSKDVYVETADN